MSSPLRGTITFVFLSLLLLLFFLFVLSSFSSFVSFFFLRKRRRRESGEEAESRLDACPAREMHKPRGKLRIHSLSSRGSRGAAPRRGIGLLVSRQQETWKACAHGVKRRRRRRRRGEGRAGEKRRLERGEDAGEIERVETGAETFIAWFQRRTAARAVSVEGKEVEESGVAREAVIFLRATTVCATSLARGVAVSSHQLQQSPLYFLSLPLPLCLLVLGF